MANERIQRRLVAILAADVVGYSRLMERDETTTLTELKGRWNEVVEPLVARHQGRIFKRIGDGMLVEFGSAVSAVECAAEVQKAMAAVNDEPGGSTHRAAHRRQSRRRHGRRQRPLWGWRQCGVPYRGACRSGRGGDFGGRPRACARPHRDRFRRQRQSRGQEHRTPAAYLDLVAGHRHGRDPRCGWRDAAAASRASRRSLSCRSTTCRAIPSRAILPTGSPRTSSPIFRRSSGLFVIARNSSFAYKGQAPDIRKVSRELGVRYVLEGSVRRAGSRVRINAQMIDGTSGGHLWAERYDRDIEDIFAVQDEVTRTIVDALKVKLTAGEEALRESRSKVDPEAYDLDRPRPPDRDAASSRGDGGSAQNAGARYRDRSRSSRSLMRGSRSFLSLNTPISGTVRRPIT